MSVSAKSRPLPRQRAEKKEPVPAPAATPTTPESAPPVYQGDYYGLLIWFGGALILALLHVGNIVYWWIKR